VVLTSLNYTILVQFYSRGHPIKLQVVQ